MLYFSELFGEKIFLENNQVIGKLLDLLFVPVESPLITKFVIKTTDKQIFYIPAQYFKKNDMGFSLKNDYTKKEKKENEISLLHKLQNQQIIDIDGAKIIRVNDVVISDVPVYTISGIDIGVLGVFRWIGAAKFLSTLLRNFGIHYKSQFIPYSEIEQDQLAQGRIVLREARERLKKIHPEDLAEHLEHATIRNVLHSLKVMDDDMSARVISDLNVDYQREIFKKFSPEHAGEILSLIDADEAVDVLLSLDIERREAILEHIKHGKKGHILHLLHLAKTPIGHLMSIEYFSVSADLSVKNALDLMRKVTVNYSELLYVYVLNHEGQIVGVVNVHDLLIQKPDMPMYKIMNQNLILGRLTTPKEIILRRMIKYKLYAIPIINEERKILGIVSLQDIAEDMIEKTL